MKTLLYVITDTGIDDLLVQIYRTTQEATFPNMYTIGPLGLADLPGSAVLITAQVEVTNPHDYNVGFGLRIVRYQQASGSVVQILPAAMMNITPAEHHTVRSVVVWDMPPIPDPVYIVEGYAAASAAVPGHALLVEEGCGLMQCAVFAQED